MILEAGPSAQGGQGSTVFLLLAIVVYKILAQEKRLDATSVLKIS